MVLKTYFHDEVFSLTRPESEIEFVGYSLPYYRDVHTRIKAGLSSPQIPPVSVPLTEYESVHTRDYLDKLSKLSTGHNPGGEDLDAPKLSGECSGLYYALPGYEYALGGMYRALEEMKAGKLHRAFCSSMPGHHAHPDWGHGYCLLNTQAAAARYAVKLGFKKVLILDWDIHHGDGTQDIFTNDPDVYQISIHNAADLYMGAVRVVHEGTTIAGQKAGHLNIPVFESTLKDEFFRELELEGTYCRGPEAIPRFRQSLQSLPFQPELIIIFAGMDSHRDDCGKDITDWVEDDFRYLTRVVLDAAFEWGIPVLSSPGGGYNVDSAVSTALAHYEELRTYRV